MNFPKWMTVCLNVYRYPDYPPAVYVHFARLLYTQSPGLLNKLDENWDSPLTVAAAHDMAEMTELLLELGANVYPHGKSEGSVLKYLDKRSNSSSKRDILRLLFAAGVDPTEVSRDALSYGHTLIMQLVRLSTRNPREQFEDLYIAIYIRTVAEFMLAKPVVASTSRRKAGGRARGDDDAKVDGHTASRKRSRR
jgi:hypothetical protein